MITIDFGGLFADIERYAQAAEREAREANEIAAEILEARVKERARADESWASLADHVQVWSKDGMLVLGVQHREFSSQAMLLEYGDETTPPSPLFRTSGPDMAVASQAANDHVQSSLS